MEHTSGVSNAKRWIKESKEGHELIKKLNENSNNQ